MQFTWSEADGTAQQLVGATLPGTPVMVVGSNGRVAWASPPPNSMSATSAARHGRGPHQRLPRGWGVAGVRHLHEEIRVAGGSNVVAEIPWSPWGPVGTNALGQWVSFRWAMQLPEAANFGLLTFENASKVADLLDLAPACGLPG